MWELQGPVVIDSGIVGVPAPACSSAALARPSCRAKHKIKTLGGGGQDVVIPEKLSYTMKKGQEMIKRRSTNEAPK